jgi:hypothetical protein
MSNAQVHLVSISGRFTHQIWLAAASEDAAIRRAEALWREDVSPFTLRDRAIDCTTVIETQEVRS